MHSAFDDADNERRRRRIEKPSTALLATLHSRLRLPVGRLHFAPIGNLPSRASMPRITHGLYFPQWHFMTLLRTLESFSVIEIRHLVSSVPKLGAQSQCFPSLAPFTSRYRSRTSLAGHEPLEHGILLVVASR